MVPFLILLPCSHDIILKIPSFLSLLLHPLSLSLFFLFFLSFFIFWGPHKKPLLLQIRFFFYLKIMSFRSFKAIIQKKLYHIWCRERERTKNRKKKYNNNNNIIYIICLSVLYLICLSVSLSCYLVY